MLVLAWMFISACVLMLAYLVGWKSCTLSAVFLGCEGISNAFDRDEMSELSAADHDVRYVCELQQSFFFFFWQKVKAKLAEEGLPSKVEDFLKIQPRLRPLCAI